MYFVLKGNNYCVAKFVQSYLGFNIHRATPELHALAADFNMFYGGIQLEKTS